MANYQSQFDFVLSAGVDTASIKQDILKAYKDVQVNINGQKLTISNITIDSKNALESFKEQINKIGLSNGIKIEVNTEQFKEAQAEITRLQTLLDKTNLKTVDKKFQKNNLTETFKSLSQTVQKFTKEDLERFGQAAEKAWNGLSRKRGSFEDYKEEYIYNQKLYEVMKNQKTELLAIQSVDGWSNEVDKLSRAYELIKSITAIQSKLSSTSYSRDAFEDLNIENISKIEIGTIKEKYKSLVNDAERDIRKFEGVLHDEFNKLIESWVNGSQQINNAPVMPDVKTEGVKERIAELQQYLEELQAKLQVTVAKIAQAELGVDKGFADSENALVKAQQEFDDLSRKIKNTTNEMVNLKVTSSDFDGLTDNDLSVKSDEASKSVRRLTREIEQLDASRIDISGLSDDDIINRMKEINNELSNMISGKTAPQKQQIVNTAEYKGLLSQFKLFYEYASSNNLDLSEASLGIKPAQLNARVAQAKNISLFNEETYNHLVEQRNEQQAIFDKCQEELKLRQNIVQEIVKAEQSQQAIANDVPVVETTPKEDVHSDNIGEKFADGETKRIKLIPDVSTFKEDSEAALSTISVDKEVKLIPGYNENSSTITQESNAFDTVKQSVETLTKAIEAKTTAITQEKIAMDVASQGEVVSIQSIIDKINKLNQKIANIEKLKIQIDGVENLDSIEHIDLNKLQVSNSILDNLTTLTYILETLKSLVIDIQNLNLSNVLSNDSLSSIKFTKENSDALDTIIQSLPALDNALTNFGSVQNTIQNIEELTKKIAILKGVVDNLKDIKVEVIENTTTGTTETKVNGKKSVDPDERGVALSTVLSHTAQDYEDIAKYARDVNPQLSETLKIIQQIKRNADGSFAEAFVVSDNNGNSATVNKNGKYYLGHSVVKDDIAVAKQEQKELNDAIAEYKQHLKEVQALDAKNTKTKESNANYLLSEQLKSMEKIAKIKTDIIARESSGKDTSILEQKLFYEKQYCNSLAEELEYYKGTVAYQERIAVVKNKSKETSLIVEDAKVLAQQKESEKAWKNKVEARKQARKQERKDAEAQAKAELEIQKRLAKEEEAALKHAKEVAEAQRKYEEDLQQQRAKSRADYESWWNSAYETEGKSLASDYHKLEQTLIKIDKLQNEQRSKGLSNAKQIELNKLLGDQITLENSIEEYNKRGIEDAKAELSLQETKNALGGVAFSVQKGKHKDAFDEALKIDASKFIDVEKIQHAQNELKNLYATMTNGAKRSVTENEQLEKEFKDQLDIINQLAQASKLRIQKNGTQYIGQVAAGSNIEQSRDEILKLVNTLKLGEVSFDTFTQGHRAMIVSIKGSDNQIRKFKIALDQTTGAVTALYLNEKKYTSFGAQWIAGVKRKFVELTQYMSGISVITKVWTELQRGFAIVRELDTALTEMRKVSDETVDSLKNFQKESFNIAKSVGATAATIQNSTADFMRLGESLDDAAESARVSNILLNVSEFESIDEATESLVAMSQAYKEFDKIDIVDKLNNIGNNFAISTDGLATALQNSASALKTAQNDLDESIALATAGNAVVQDPDKVGAGKLCPNT